MSTLSLRLPNSLHSELKELAKKEGISINQLITTAVAEKMSALLTAELLENRGKRGSRELYLSALDKVPSVPPEKGDELL